MSGLLGKSTAVLAACFLVSAVAVLPLTSAFGAGIVIHYKHESYKAFQRQMAAGQIRAVTFNKKPHSVRITLQDGSHVLAIYPSHDEPQLAAALSAKGVTVAVLKPKVKAKPAVHHTLRYIAGGILVVVILAILAVLLIGRRRNLAGVGDGPGAGAADGPGAGAPDGPGAGAVDSPG
jgi:ATP-dependent Zn protease